MNNASINGTIDGGGNETINGDNNGTTVFGFNGTTTGKFMSVKKQKRQFCI